jgi:SAM-dependent methyltransferase
LAPPARSRAQEAGLANLTFVRADMQTDSVPGAPFDAVFSRLGVMFFADFVAAFTNIRSQMKPGGRLVFVCFQAMAENPWYGGEIVAKYAPPRPPSRFPSPSPFALGNEPLTREFLGEAGFSDIVFSPVQGEVEGPVGERPGSAAMLMAFGLAPDVLAAAIDELRANEARFIRDGKLVMNRKLWVVQAKNPG